MSSTSTDKVDYQYLSIDSVFLLFFYFLCKSQGIRSALVSKIPPSVKGTCSLLSAKVSHSIRNEGTEDTKIEDLWLDICNKHDECNEAIKKTKGVAFFYPL